MILVIFSILPIFLLILLGTVVKHFRLASAEQLMGLEKLTFYIFFPSLLVQTLYKADFSAVAAGNSAIAFLVGILTMMLIGFLIRLPLRRFLAISDPSYSSVFQGFTRWNAFISLAVAQTFESSFAITIVTIGIAMMVIPSNLINVIVVTRLGNGNLTNRKLFKLVILNPFIIAVFIGLLINFLSLKLPLPVETTLKMVSQTALPIGLILVGAGLTFKMPKSSFLAAGFSTSMKLILAPIIFLTVAYFLGVPTKEMLPIAICAGVPSAMNGYLIAKELGGDAPLYAAIATLQTLASIITVPLIIVSVPYLFG